ncbi:hypothetical protein NX801_02550 [Streptomyces sp. LP05-1]|uniref:Uncharacterized protein n=1 Tax=Streptomyces pyxinae TaxID=2970734 RepID=A0ABT2CAZ3_9ACTN|nr:hypothetical protein [Streptomyces sp. LP05-1]MCS0634559.1 hypothetical protein [Streptomyces sp. LP05-1]
MNGRERREEEVRRLLAPPGLRLPPDVLPGAVARGTRLRHRTRALRRLLWLLLVAVAVAFAVWAAATEPWHRPPLDVSPVFTGG